MKMWTRIGLLFVLLCSTLSHAQTLGYQQRQLLKDAEGYLDEVEGTLQAITQKLSTMQSGGVVQMQDVQSCVSAKDRVVQRMDYANTRFKQLPAGNADVKEQLDRLPALQKSLAEVTAKIDGLRGGAQAALDQGNNPGYQADFNRLREIAVMYADPQILQSQLERAANVASQMPAVRAERTNIAQKYAALLQQSAPQSRELQGVLNHFDSQFGEFDRAVQQYKAQMYDKMNADIDELLRLGNEGVKEERPGYFGETGGVNSSLIVIDRKFALMSALAPEAPQTAAARQRIDSARQQLAAMKAKLNDAIVAGNNLPNDSYSGQDKADLINLVKSKWSQSGNAKTILKVGINSNDWQRDAFWEWRSTASAWYKTDRSRIQGYVLVQGNEKEAHAYYINISKDHLNNDSLAASFFNDPRAEVDVTYRMLMSKVR